MNPAPRPATAAAAAPLSDHFRYHGWLAPGMRLFRQIGFPAKALCITLAFLAPLTMSMGYLTLGAQEQIASTRAELRGAEFVRSALTLVQAAQARRLAATLQPQDVDGAQAAVQSGFDQLAKKQAALGADFGTAAEFDTLSKAHGQLMQTPLAATPDASFGAHSAYIAAALNLVHTAADGSGLVLDPEADTFHMMNMAVLRGPMQYENTAMLHGLGTLALRSGQLSRQRRDNLQAWTAVQSFLERDVESAFQKGVGPSVEIAAGMDMPGADAISEAFHQAVLGQLMGDSMQGDEAGFAARGAAAVKVQVALCNKVMLLLEERLQLRIDRLQRTLYEQLGATVLFLALAAYLLLAFYRVMTGGLNEVARHLEAITEGNLTTRPKPWGRDEAAVLMTTLGTMQDSLRRIVGAVLDGAANVQSASSQIAAASADLSHRTEQSAACLQQTAASMAQISESVQQANATVTEAGERVHDNTEAAGRGGQAFSEVAQNMDRIRNSSGRIGEIIGVIDSIAFQTNILALNAAVEAARAGEQGRGFAVVATEVRALAARSATAAREIKALIGASIEQVESGNAVVANAGAVMQSVVGNAQQMAQLMASIAQGAQKQQRGIGEVGAAVRELDDSTQRNSALVEETTAASNALAEQAQRLLTEVSFFRLA